MYSSVRNTIDHLLHHHQDHARVSGLLQLQQGNQQIRNGVGHSQSDPSYPMGAASAEMLHREQFGASVHPEPDSTEHQHECTRDIPTAEYRAIQKVFHIPMEGNGQDTPAATTEAEERQARSWAWACETHSILQHQHE